jgi:hypothetical protein
MPAAKPKSHDHADPDVLNSMYRRQLKIRDARVRAKSREQELVTERKELDGRLDRLGKGETPEDLKVSRRLVVVLREIKWVRNQIGSLADTFESTLESAQQGRLFDDDEDIGFKEPTEADLFRPDNHDPDQLELGESHEKSASKRKSPAGPAAPTSNGPVGVPDLNYSGWRAELRHDERDVSVLVSHGVSDRAVATLRRHGITELRSLAAPLPTAMPGTFGRLTGLDGITPGDESAIEDAMTALGAEVETAENAKLVGAAPTAPKPTKVKPPAKVKGRRSAG